MKITIKTLKGELFNVEAEPTETILDVKNKIKEQKAFEVDSQKLVFKGKNTVNTETLQTLGIKEGDFMVVMVTIKKPEPPKEAPKPVEIPKATTTVPTVPTVPAVPSTTQSATSPTTGNPPVPGQTGLVTGQQYEQSVQNLMGMGFSREEVIAALRAAYNNPERAVEYLVNGLPPTAHRTHSHGQGQAPPAPVPGAATTGTTGASGLDASMLATLVNSPQFAHIQQMIRNDPSSLPVFLQQIAQTSPQLFQLISENPELFERLIMQGGPPQPPPGTIQITAEEKAAIERLAALGFSKMEAAQAYIACDKNEELAANLLFDRLANGDIEPGVGGEGGPEEPPGGDEGDDGHDDDNLFS